MLTASLYSGCAGLSLVLILGLGCWTDLKFSRIPNRLSLVGAGAGLVLQTLFFGLEGAGNALGGMGVGLAMFLPAYLLWGLGAGDVKLMAAVGAWLGPYPTFIAGVFTVIAGGALGLAILLVKKGGLAGLRRYSLMLRCLFTTGHLYYIPAAPGEAAGERFPYALAIAAGTLVAWWWI